MELFVIRHAWAGQYGDPAYPDDSLRPLTAEGRDRFTRMVDHLVPRGLKPQLILTSPMLRCVQTAQVLATALGENTQVLVRKELLPGGDPKHLIATTEKHAAGMNQVAWVGHAPDVGSFAAELIGLENGWLDMKKGGDRRDRVS